MMEPIASPRWAPAPMAPMPPMAASPAGSLHLPPGGRAASPDPIRGVSPSRFPPLPLGPVVVASPRQHAGLQSLSAVLQTNLPGKQMVAPMAPVAGHVPALMPAQPGQSVQPQVQVRYQSPGPILHPLQPTMVSPRGYVVAPAAPTLPPTPEVMPRHRLVMAPGSPRAQTMSAQNLQTAEPVTSPIANHRLILQSHGSVPLIQSIYSPLRAPEISDPGSQDSLAQQVKALQAARASAPPLNLSEALKRWPCPETPIHLQDEMELSDPPEADAMSVSAEPEEPIAPEEKEPLERAGDAAPAPAAPPAPAHERSGKAPRPTLSSSRSRTTSSRTSAQMRRLSLMPEVQEAAQQCRKELQQRAQELNAKDLRELRQLLRPPRQVKQVLDTICMLLGEKAGNKGYNWKKILTESLPNKLADFDPQAMSSAQRSKVLEALGDQDFSQETLAKTHQPCIGLSRWCACISNFVSKSNHLVSEGKSFNAAMLPTISVDSLGGSAPSLKGSGAKGPKGPKGRSQSPGNRRGAVNGKGKGRDPSPFVVEPDLRSLSSSELTKVSELKVIKPNVGEVVFHGLTDCTDLDVARDIVLKRGYVLVYPDQKNKPPPGEGLNKHATVTMYQCFPAGEPIRTLSDEAVQEYKDKIRRKTEENSACTFIDYDCQTGVWKFQVERF